MSTNKEKGLESHSSNMVAPREFTSTNDKSGWVVIRSNNTQKIKISKKLQDHKEEKKLKLID